MNLTELKTAAQAIIAIPDTVDDFAAITFRTTSGSLNNAYLRESDPESIISRESQRSYRTTANGWAHTTDLVVRCRDTGTRDLDGETIYQTPNGTVFIYYYHPGCAAYFDSGVIRAPRLTVSP